MQGPTPWVDPRSHPAADRRKPSAQPTSDPDDLVDLHRFCREGRLYEVEEWIRAGRPLQAVPGATIKGRRFASALEIALEQGNQALTLLLLCNGYDPNLESGSPLNLALRSRRWDLLDLLLEWGADPHQVSLTDLFDTYQSDLFRRFRNLGVDLTANHELGEALAYHPGNKPLFGFAKRHREQDPKMQKELNIALVHHAAEDNEKGVQLCLWAGADPHVPAPSLRCPDGADEDQDEEDPGVRFLGFTAIEEACRAGHVGILERLRPDPARDDLDGLYRDAASGVIIEVLGRCGLPKAVGTIIRSQVFWLQHQHSGRPRSTDTLQCLFKIGARWETSAPDEIADVRRALLKMTDYTFIDVMKLFATDAYCAPDILQALGRTPAIRDRMAKVGFIPPPVNDHRWFERTRPTRARDVLSKFGVVLPKPETQVPTVVQVGRYRRATHNVRLDRKTLFDLVWSEPVEKLAKRWALSGRGLAKICQRIRVPVPPRGFWAKTQYGRQMRRPCLPQLRPGEAEEIVIHLAGGADDTSA